VPTTFGLKAAGWLDGLHRHVDRLDAMLPRLLVAQMGGAVGTLASLGREGDAVARAVAEELDLGVSDMPWHGQRDRLAELAGWLGLVVGSLGKMARDLSLMTQTEVGEAFEPAAPGRGGSSTMPHKRNPVACAAILAAAARAPGLVASMLAAMPQEHERGLGGWQAEWSTLPELCRLAGGAVARARGLIEGLELDRERMRANLDLTKGQIMAEAVMMALGDRLGRLEAHHRIGEACRRAAASGRDLGAVIAEDEALSGLLKPGELERLMDPGEYTGMAEAMVTRVVERWRAR
jgi:3-carboxy-cis,cis-muconate cycloisomerase